MIAKAFQLIIDWNACTGCRLCEVECSKFHHDTINPELSRIRIYSYYPGPMNIPIVCSYCSDFPCVKACPTNALYYDQKESLLKVMEEKCLGAKCSSCARACETERSGAIRFSSDYDYPLVCDLCKGDPQCAKACPHGVIAYIPKIIDGRHLADKPATICEEMTEQWYPATAEKRVEWSE